jgi:hypothetical protein
MPPQKPPVRRVYRGVSLIFAVLLVGLLVLTAGGAMALGSSKAAPALQKMSEQQSFSATKSGAAIPRVRLQTTSTGGPSDGGTTKATDAGSNSTHSENQGSGAGTDNAQGDL